MTGYGIRKVFETTPMGHYSSSPGSIYPALRRLKQEGLICRPTHPDSGKKVFSITPAGVQSFKNWLELPVDRESIIRHSDEQLLRFSLMDDLVEVEKKISFLEQFKKEIDDYVRELLIWRSEAADTIPLHGILALDSGIETYKAQSAWAAYAVRVLMSYND